MIPADTGLKAKPHFPPGAGEMVGRQRQNSAGEPKHNQSSVPLPGHLTNLLKGR